MGRVLGTKVCTPSTCNSSNIANSVWFNLSNTYDLAGDPASYTDGVNTTIGESYDAAGRLSTVKSTPNGGTPVTLWTASGYGPIGLTNATLGNGVVETLAYNNRPWLQSQSAKSASGVTIFSEGLTYYPDGDVNAVTDPVNGNWTYSYDTLRRISTGVSTNTGQACQFAYDHFGNRTMEAPYQTGSCLSQSLSFTGSSTNHVDGDCYDAAGELLNAGPCAPTGSRNPYFYDGYGTLLVGNYNFSNYTSYSVDEYERRVAKWQSGVMQRQYLYGADGNPVAELDGSGSWLQTNVHAGGMFLAQLLPTATTYLHTDHLGTIRAESNSSGTRIMTCSNLPFGDSLNCNGNTGPSGYHFTGKERDTESGNDYFGARYYASSMGRFMSPDWSKSPEAVPYADLEKPQTLNLYTYADNNPLSVTDPDGHCDWCQELKNWLSGNGWYTNDQITEQHRSWLLEQAKTDTEAQIVRGSNAKDVNDNYSCLHNAKCAQDMANITQQLIQAGSMLTPWGWRGQPSYNDALKKLNQPNTPQGTTDLPDGVDGKVPTRTQAKQMIEDAGGKVIRGEETGHAPGGNSPHTYPHINYETAQGMKGTIRVQ
jgi:RHS repeat-associated protein